MLLVLVSSGSCQAWRAGVTPTKQEILIAPPGIVLEIPIDWHYQTIAIAATEQQPSATLTRIEPNQAQVPGSPRLEVYVPAKTERPAVLEGLLTRTLQSMRDLEAKGGISIEHVHQEPRTIAQLPAYFISHQFTVTSSKQVISQQALLLILHGSEVSLTAAGTTELFAPLEPTMLTIMQQVRQSASPSQP